MGFLVLVALLPLATLWCACSLLPRHIRKMRMLWDILYHTARSAWLLLSRPRGSPAHREPWEQPKERATKSSISVIIPSLNELANLGRIRDTLEAARKDGCELILSDGGSTDGTQGLAREIGAKEKHTHLIHVTYTRTSTQAH